MEKIKFVITDYIESDLNYEKSIARDLGIDLHDHQLKNAPQPDLIQAVKDADIILVNMAQFNAEVIQGLTHCRLILRHGIGYDNVDIKAATKAGIVVANYPTYCVQDVAEQAITLMMACQRKLLIQNRLLEKSVTAKKWIFEEVYPVYRLKGKTVGIVGLGRIGGTVFRMLSGFGVEVLIHDPYLSGKRKKEYGIGVSSFDELLSKSDIITIHCPLTWEETHHMFDTPQFEKMKETAILINTARGGIVNIDALNSALEENKLGGAGIDVYEEEPPGAELAILKNPKALCTPHLSWLSEESGMAIREDYMDDVRKFVKGEIPKNILNPEVEINF